jgi:hypothetical protein
MEIQQASNYTKTPVVLVSHQLDVIEQGAVHY